MVRPFSWSTAVVLTVAWLINTAQLPPKKNTWFKTVLLGVTHAAGHKKKYVLWSWARKREFSIIEQGSVKAWGKGQRTKNGCIKSGSLLCSLIKRRSIRTKLVTFSTNLSLGRGRLGSCGTAQHICMADRDKCWLITTGCFAKWRMCSATTAHKTYLCCSKHAKAVFFSDATLLLFLMILHRFSF